MSHFIVAVGHTASGNIGCGAVNKLNESNCTREIAPLVREGLVENGHQVTFLQIDNSNTYLFEDCHARAKQANKVGGDLYVEIHINAGGGTGSEVCVNLNASTTTRKIAARVSSAIATSIGFPDRGVKPENLIVLNETSMPAILVECLFCDSSDAYRYDAQQLANAIVSGLLNTQVTTPAKYKLGWTQDNTGWWYCTDAKNGYYHTSQNGWKEIDGAWYIFDARGYALQHKWYYHTDGNWYFLNTSCKMAASEWISWGDLWYYVDKDGKMLYSQLFTDTNGKKYYFDEDGAMLCGTSFNGMSFGPDGALIEKVIAIKSKKK